MWKSSIFLVLALGVCVYLSAAAFPNLDNFCVNKPDGKYPHPVCTKFIHCSNQNTYIKDCALGTKYNSRTTHCDLFSNVDCSDRGYCFDRPCKNGGKCARRPKGYICKCPHGYTGKNCQITKVFPCDAYPCRNGGTCRNVGKGYVCRCPQGFKGKNCQIVDRCDPNPCRNGGTCTNVRGGYRCTCPAGYKGSNCQTVDRCDPNPCRNGGTCTNVRGGYRCTCPAGYKGSNCQTVDPCVPNPCKNGGRCTNVRGGYRCWCRPGFMGRNCQTVNHCHRNPCQNGGTCLNLPKSYKCVCPSGFKGKRCHEKVQCTDSNGCTYDVGMSYINAGCSGRCTCGANGISGCVSLCPPRLIKCHPGQVLQDYYEPVKGTWCYCKRQRCVQERTLVNCATAPPGLYPHPTDCSFYLLCKNKIRITKQCNRGLHFNAKTKRCDTPKNAKCGSVSITCL